MSQSHPLETGTAPARAQKTKRPQGSPVHSVDDWSDIVDDIQAARHPLGEQQLRDRRAEHTRSRLPQLDLPGFGEPEDDCGRYIPEAMRWCAECGDVKQHKHNCLRYDCPDHAPYAVRRRAAGSSSGTGIAPQLGALIRWLGAYYSEPFDYHHLVISPGTDHLTESDVPLERTKQLCRRIMDKLGIQGVLIYHPWSGDHEDPDVDDMGKWKTRLYHGRDWSGDVREELEYRPHFHIIGVAARASIDLSRWGEASEETGWVIKRITKPDSNVSIEDEAEMATKLTYALSHAGIYEVGDQRRLAAWMKGPDVNDVRVSDSLKIDLANKVHNGAQDTLGIAPPSFTCEQEVPVRLRRRARPRELEDVHRVSDRRREAGGPLAIEPIGGWTGPDVDVKSRSRLGGMTVGGPGGWPSSDDDLEHHGVPKTQECGGYVRHISTAGEKLLDADWREYALYVDDLEAAYRSYVNVMMAKGLDPLEDGEPLLPEEEDPPPDAPPPD